MSETANPAEVVARMADFAELTAQSVAPVNGALDNLLDVSFTITAELGKVTMSIGEILKLGVGSVIELNRSTTDPVDITVQGVLLARGEIVVVDDHFAVRIKEIIDPKKRG